MADLDVSEMVLGRYCVLQGWGLQMKMSLSGTYFQKCY